MVDLVTLHFSPACHGLSYKKTAVMVRGLWHEAHLMCVLSCVNFFMSVCFPAQCPGDWYWSMCAACCVSLSSPQKWSPFGDLWSPGADPKPNYVGGAQLDCSPIHLPLSTQSQKRGETFHLSTTVNVEFCQDHKSLEETEWKCSHKLLGLNLTSEQWMRCFSQHATAVLHAWQQMILLGGLLEPNCWVFILNMNSQPNEKQQWLLC